MRSAFFRLWGMPIVLGVLTCIGLLSALLGDGIWDALSAVTLAGPVLVAIWASFRRPRN